MPWSPTPVPLGALTSSVEGACLVHGNPGVLVSGITQDSRRVAPGDLFVAIAGFDRDGTSFAPDALARGAIAVVAERAIDTDVPLVLVPHARQALADLSAALYGHPSREMP